MLKSTLTLCLALAAANVIAGEPVKTVVEKEKTWCETLWEYPVLYKNKDTFVQEFRLIGRFHGDVYSIDSAQGYDSDWAVRRLRGGAVLKLQGNIEIKAMRDHGYDVDFAVGITGASSTIGPIMPPTQPRVV